MTRAVLDDVRKRLRAAFPASADVTGVPFQRAPSRLPAFAAAIGLTGSEPVSMGSAARLDDYDLRLVFWPAPHRADADGSAMLAALEADIRAALVAAPADLGGLVWSISPVTADGEIEAGDERQPRLDLLFSVQVLRG
ncbi:MAG: hypothetical protein Q4G25_15075 [Paracoccus sp. (in: a-proteobacteria)]|nr:hypothetical protein [Paracoccus sp. (in: a-proteobacteria)]